MTALALPRGEAGPWPRAIVGLGVAAAAILLLFARDASAMAWLWWDSSSFGHCLFVPPIIAGLVWQRRAGLARMVPTPWLAGLALVLLGALAWLLGDAAGVALARHLGVILMLQGATVTMLGRDVARALTFPIAYALFLVPAGEELVAPLQTLTAKLAMALLHLTGVPAAIDGVLITIPHATFKVAEACSGIQFLIAMVALGALAANQCFESRTRRAVFMAVSVVVPVLANGARAWATIWVSWLTDTNFGAGFDHVVFGWVFFGIVIAIVMAIGWRFFDRAADAPFFDPAALQPIPPATTPQRTALAALLVIACALAPIAWAARAQAPAGAVPPVVLPEVPGWTRVATTPRHAWAPHFAGADRIAQARYRDASGRVVDLAVAVYADQAEGRELVGHGQGAVDPASDWAWTEDAAAPAGADGERISAPGPVVREVATFYRVGDVLTGSPHRVKLETLKVRLLGSPRSAAAVLVSAEEPGAHDAIAAFLAKLGPVEALADRAAAR